ncbi:hypothetical protein ACRARS_001732 [Yersinia enterocolitica]
MSAPYKDHRLKILTMRTPLDGLNIAARETILWPCHAFTISVPQKRKGRFNVFEVAVLKLTDAVSGDAQQIAQMLCIEKALVIFIQSRLQQLDLLDTRGELTQRGLQLLKVWQDAAIDETEYSVATVFIDLFTGKLLPFVSTQPLRFNPIIGQNQDEIITYHTYLNNNAPPTIARRITLPKEAHWRVIPEVNDIVRAIREFKKRFKRYALLNPAVDQPSPSVPMAEAITLHETPELVYLECVACIQVGNADLLVTDGCGLGFNEHFARHLTAMNVPWIGKMKRRGIIERHDENPGEEIPVLVNDTAKYPQISAPLSRANRALQDAQKIAVQTADEANEIIRLTDQAVAALYEAIEWALAYVVSVHPIERRLAVFPTQSTPENDDYLRALAKSVGLNLTGNTVSLLRVSPGKLQSVGQGNAEMQPLLLMAIVGAHLIPQHPFRHLASVDADCLAFIHVLKKTRDAVGHGNGAGTPIDTLRTYLDRAAQLIRVLVPNIDDPAVGNMVPVHRDINQLRLKARIELDAFFGTSGVHLFTPALREELIKLEMLETSPSLSNEQFAQAIQLMYSALQLSLLDVAKQRSSFAGLPSGSKDAALDRMVGCGFYPAVAVIPKRISTVNSRKVQSAIQGRSETLGAQLLAVFWLVGEKELMAFRQLEPDIVDFTAAVIARRGHNTVDISGLVRSDISSLKKRLFTTIKTLTESF